MKVTKLKNRMEQLWLAFFGRPTKEQFRLAEIFLSSAQFGLFQKLQPSEQAHALKIYAQLQANGNNHPDLLTAALLHDVGKIKFKLSVLERIMIVLGQALFPDSLQVWGAGEARGLGRAFVVAAKHAEWGAQMAENMGTTRLATALIRRHDEKGLESTEGLENRLLVELQNYDDQN